MPALPAQHMPCMFQHVCRSVPKSVPCCCGIALCAGGKRRANAVREGHVMRIQATVHPLRHLGQPSERWWPCLSSPWTLETSLEFQKQVRMRPDVTKFPVALAAAGR